MSNLWDYSRVYVQPCRKKKAKKKRNIKDSIGKISQFLGIVPFSPWAILATCLHFCACQHVDKWN
jgi:hypothetical protein